MRVKETHLAAVVIRYFRDLGAEVYQEVSIGDLSARADIVAVIGGVVHIIECKAAFGLKVVQQAWEWRRRGLGHRVSVAVPQPARNSVLRQFCGDHGIGIYEIKTAQLSYETGRCDELLAPRLFRDRSVSILTKRLREQQKTYAEAGNAVGKFWSPFKETCTQLRETVATEPGLPIRTYIERIKHHYASDKNAISSLFGWIARGKVEGIEVSDERPARLYLSGTRKLSPPQTAPLSVSTIHEEQPKAHR